MKNSWKIGIVGVIVLGLIWFLFIRNKKEGAEPTITEPEETDHCARPPVHFKPYDSEVDWGDFSQGVNQYLGDYDIWSPYAHGFLKGINVKASKAYVQYYQEEIKQYFNSSKALPSWEVAIGMYNCRSNGELPGDILLD